MLNGSLQVQYLFEMKLLTKLKYCIIMRQENLRLLEKGCSKLVFFFYYRFCLCVCVSELFPSL